MSKTRFVTFASVISEIQQSDLFMTVKTRILETPKANLNGCRVTEAFVDEIISDEERYVGLPLYADVRALRSGKYNRLGHLYDSRTGEFHSTQIGSFYQFEKEEFNDGSYLVGYARIPKRDASIRKAVSELFADGNLKFSFEISCGEYTELDDGTIEIDASENNFLEGTAIVTFPACEDAVALQFVAQRQADDTERGEMEMEMAEKEIVAEEAVETQVETAETTEQLTETDVDVTETAEAEQAEETACDDKKAEVACDDQENACNKKIADETACDDKKVACDDKETAEVLTREYHTEEHHSCAFDTETGKEASVTVRIETEKSEPVEGNLVEADDGMHIAETDPEPGDPDPTDTPTDTPAEPAVNTDPDNSDDSDDEAPGAAAEDVPNLEDEKKVAEQMIAELAETVRALAEEVKELKAQRVIASKKVDLDENNPFIASLTTEGSKYDLLTPVEKPDGHALLSR